jgi:hypothetical protein
MPRMTQAAPPPAGEAPEASPGVPLDVLLGYVERAVRGDRLLLVQLFRELQRLARLGGAPPVERRLGEVLSLVLMGDRCPDLSGLPEEAAQEIQSMLERLS